MGRRKKHNITIAPDAPRIEVAVAHPVSLTDEQMAVVEPLIRLEKQVQTLGGLAGTGKTTVIGTLMRKLNNFACCAYTGKAADVLRSKGVRASTIHSLIYDVIKDENGLPDFILKPCLPCNGIIVDEASMVGKTIYEDLLSFDLPIIFVGDHGQLEPVKEDTYLMKSPDFKLETVHRNAGDIALFAHHLRSGFPAEEYPSCLSVKIIDKQECVESLLQVDQIICALNRTRVAVNRYVRSLRGISDDSPVIGDKVISLRNSRGLRIFNGTQGIIQDVTNYNLTLLLSNDITIPIKYDVNTFNREKQELDFNSKVHPLDYAYAVTCHKAQGSEWDRVLVLEYVCPIWDHKRWAYTAASRAKEHLTWVLPE